MEETVHAVYLWGQNRGLHDTNDLRPQLTKLVEEVGELAGGIAREDHSKIFDSIGDIMVVLVQLGAIHARYLPPGMLLDASDYLPIAMTDAWLTIRERRGTLKDGVFVKEGDQ